MALEALLGVMGANALSGMSKAGGPDNPEMAQAFKELWSLIGEPAVHILQHMETVSPRSGDLDIAHNSVQNRVQGDDVVTVPNGVETIADAAQKRLVFVAREGFVAHITDVLVQNLDAAGSLAGVTVTVQAQGRTIQAVPALHYVRPVMLDRDDRLVVTVTNASGASIDVTWCILGWLRSQGASKRR